MGKMIKEFDPEYMKDCEKQNKPEMGRREFMLWWTALWLLVIFGFAVVFHTASPLWLLFIYGMGIFCEEE